MTTQRLRRLLLLAAAPAAFASAAAHAQETHERAAVIIVTATRSPAPAEASPASIVVLDRESIEAEPTPTLADVLTRVPGLQAVRSGPAGSVASVFVRGTNSKHVLALYDGVRLNDASAPNGQFDFGQETLFDAERVEVVHGPLSSLYGSDAVGGVVNLIPRRGGERAFAPLFEAQLGELGTRRVALGATGAAGGLDYGLFAERFETDGFDVTPARLSTATGDPDGSESAALTGSAELALSGGWSVDALIRQRWAEADFDTFSGGDSGFQRADDPDLRIAQNDLGLWRLGAAYGPDAGPVALKAGFGEARTERAEADGGQATFRTEGSRRFLDASAQTSPFDWAGFENVAAVLGAQLARDRIEVPVSFNDPLSAGEDSAGLFALIRGRTGALDFAASLRGDDHESFGGVTTANLGAVWALLGPRAQVVASWGTSFKAPTLSERFSASAFSAPNPDLQPEEGESWELGLRAALPLAGRSDGLALSATYYQTEIEDLIEFVFDAETFIGRNENVGRADIDGAEVRVALRPLAWVTGDIAYAFTDARNALTGARLLRRPEHAWSGRLELAPMEGLKAWARWSHTGERADVTYDDDGFFLSGAGTTPGYDLVDIGASYALTDALTVYGAVANLFDETYEQPAAFAGAPRTASIGLRGRF